MTDIVKRLCAPVSDDDDYMIGQWPGEPPKKYDALRLEAADEIERLRAALEFYGNPDNWKSGGWDHQFRMMSPEPVYIDKGDKARAALGGDK